VAACAGLVGVTGKLPLPAAGTVLGGVVAVTAELAAGGLVMLGGTVVLAGSVLGTMTVADPVPAAVGGGYGLAFGSAAAAQALNPRPTSASHAL
jgi:hypothetical protein